MNRKRSQEFHEDMISAFDEAADGLEQRDYHCSMTELECQVASQAAEEVAKRIRAMSSRYYDRYLFDRNPQSTTEAGSNASKS